MAAATTTTTVAIATATTAATTMMITVTVITAAASAHAWLLRTRLGHVHRAAFEALTIQLLNGRLGLGVRRHLDEGEALRATRLTIRNHFCGFDGADLREHLVQRVIGCGEREITNEKFLAHV